MPTKSGSPRIDNGVVSFYNRKDDPPWAEPPYDEDYAKWKNYKATFLGSLAEAKFALVGNVVVSFKAHVQYKKQTPHWYKPAVNIHPSRKPTDNKKLLHEGNRRNPTTPQGFDTYDYRPDKKTLKEYDDEYKYNPVNRNRQRSPDANVFKKRTTADWWEEKSPDQQTEYITEHPASHKAKEAVEKKKRRKSPKAARRRNAVNKAKWNTLMETKHPADRAAFETARSRKLRVPPAWKNIWVNPDKNGDLQVTGHDVAGHKNYLYSAKHNERKKAEKFKRLQWFDRFKVKLDSRILRDMKKSEEARILYLISKTGFRVGGDEAATREEEKSFGASTLTSNHVTVVGDEVHFNFTGKKQINQDHITHDPLIARMISQAKARVKEGEQIFKSDYGSLRKYMRYLSSKVSKKQMFNIKDFRTHVATTTALALVAGMPVPKTAKQLKQSILDVATKVSQRLGNTPSMAKNSYIDPAVFQTWEAA